jgi:hypothetical protein
MLIVPLGLNAFSNNSFYIPKVPYVYSMFI